MFYILSKTLSTLLLPITWIILLGVIGWFVSQKGSTSRFIFKLITICSFLLSNSFLSNELMKLWEYDPTITEQLEVSKKENIGVVLGGYLKAFKEPSDRFHTSKGADRLIQSIDLYKKDLIQGIILTGAHTRFTGQSIPESLLAKGFLEETGIPKRKIHIDTLAKNTYENALNTKLIISENFEDKQIVLITSAFHMRRAKACFDKQGIQTIPYAVDFYTSDHVSDWAYFLLPSQAALNSNSTLIREIVGYLTYQYKGYL